MAVFMNVNWHGFDFSLSIPSFAGIFVHDETDSEEYDELWADTVMCAGGHAFGYSGDVSMWGAFHFIIPYKKLMPYLTPKVKRLISE